jgi:hypothetical protein
MKISELFESSYLGKLEPLSPEEKVEVLDVVKKVKQSDEYKQALTIFDDVSGQSAIKNGSFSFSSKKKIANLINDTYVIYRNGQIRIANSKNSRLGPVKSPDPDPDLFTRYINAIKSIQSKFDERLAKDDKKQIQHPNLYEENLSSLTQRNFADTVTTLTITKCNNLVDLQGMPAKQIKDQFYLQDCEKIKSLEGMTPNIKNIKFNTLPNLSSFEGMTQKADYIYMRDLPGITSLEGFTKVCVSIKMIMFPNLISLENVDKHLEEVQEFMIPINVKSNVLGLLKIRKLRMVEAAPGASKELEQVAKIITKHLRMTQDVLECQSDLMEAGLKDFAKL